MMTPTRIVRHDRHRRSGRLDGNGRLGGQDHPGAEWRPDPRCLCRPSPTKDESAPGRDGTDQGAGATSAAPLPVAPESASLRGSRKVYFAASSVADEPRELEPAEPASACACHASPSSSPQRRPAGNLQRRSRAVGAVVRGAEPEGSRGSSEGSDRRGRAASGPPGQARIGHQEVAGPGQRPEVCPGPGTARPRPQTCPGPRMRAIWSRSSPPALAELGPTSVSSGRPRRRQRQRRSRRAATGRPR